MNSSTDLVIAPISPDEWKSFSTLLTELQRVDRTDLYLPVARLQLLNLLHSPEFQHLILRRLRGRDGAIWGIYHTKTKS